MGSADLKKRIYVADHFLYGKGHAAIASFVGLGDVEGKSMADYPYLDDYAKPMLDELVWWSKTLKEGRSGDRVAEAA